ncbi:hypothetical protein QYE76_028906 [Lolium multiflorum]|uniref:Reverse transcriptase n=1 Tax=Lolium multiflorum TaxID=4521 RepID=A0AAD8QQE9_LOLMU|nr:hypothetical protein QYE76_028906 [Lolium multiflorum]
MAYSRPTYRLPQISPRHEYPEGVIVENQLRVWDFSRRRSGKELAEFFLSAGYRHLNRPCRAPPMFVLEPYVVYDIGMTVRFANPHDAFFLLGKVFWCGCEFIAFTACNIFTEFYAIFPSPGNMHCLLQLPLPACRRVMDVACLGIYAPLYYLLHVSSTMSHRGYSPLLVLIVCVFRLVAKFGSRPYQACLPPRSPARPILVAVFLLPRGCEYMKPSENTNKVIKIFRSFARQDKFHLREDHRCHLKFDTENEARTSGLNFSSRNLLDSAAGGTFMSITLGAATKLLDDMMINYSEWHTERTPQGKKVNSVEETSSLSDKIDVIMSMLVNGRSHVDPNNVPLASLVAQEEHVDVNFIKNNNFNNNAYRNNFGNNNYRPYPSTSSNGYGNSYNNNKSVPSDLEVMLKEFISTQTAFNKSVEENFGKIDVLASKIDSLALDVDLLKLKVMPNEVKDTKSFAKTNAIQVQINDNIRMMAELHARWEREEREEKLAKENNIAKVWNITTSNADASYVAKPPTINDDGGEGRRGRGAKVGPDHRPARPWQARHPWCGGPIAPFASFLRVSFVRKPKPRREPHEGVQPPLRAENTREKELSGGQESAGEIPSRRWKSTPSPSSSSWTSSPSSSSSSSPPSTPPSPPLHLVTAVTIWQHLENSESEAFRKERDELEEIFLRQPILKHDLPVEDLGTTPPPKEDPVFDLKPLPNKLKYAHIDDKKIYPVIISSKLSEIEEERWVSPVHCVPKKGGMTVVPNDNDELIPQRIVVGYRMCIDFRKVNKVTKKDHYPLPFIDQMLERLSKNTHFCFLDGYSGFSQIVKAKDQEKTTFTCPYGTYAYRRMPFGLCNAPATFQRCMSAIFHGFCESIVERCEETNLVLNWEKCHFMVNEGIVLGHKISERGIEVDRAKVEAIEKMPYPRDVKGAVLGQRVDKKLNVIHYASKTLDAAQRNYATTEKELLAVVFACDKFRLYIVDSKVTIHTDHAAIRYLMTKKDAKPRLIRLENIAYDPVPVNDSFPNEQLAVIKIHHVLVGNSEGQFFEDVVNPYMNELKMHPKELLLVDGELQIKDVQGPKGEGSLEDRMEKLEQGVFNYKKMVEREVDIFHKIVSELIDGHKKETAKLWDDIFSLHDTTNKLQAQLYDVHNQNCEYENRFKRISHAASFRFPETKMSFVDGGPLPWKSDDGKDSPSSPKE